MNPTANIAAIHRLVWIGLLAALTAAGALIIVPIGPVPISLQTMFVVLAGLILGPRASVYAMLVYLAAGCLGLPVFAGGKAGLAVFLGPTGGFLLAFIPGAMISGFGGGADKPMAWSFICCLAATMLILFLGSLQLAAVMGISLLKALSVGAVPFIPGGVAKCVAAVSIYRFLSSRKLLPL